MAIAQNHKAMAYQERLQARQQVVAQNISSQVLGGKALDVVWNLTLVGNLISANVPYGKLEAIAQVDGVKDVCLEPVSYTHLDVYKRQADSRSEFPMVPKYSPLYRRPRSWNPRPWRCV